MSERRPGRPPRLSREGIVAAAEEIVEREGIDALSMRRVADALGSSTMSLYRHVRDKDELLVLLMDRIVVRLARPELPDDPHRRLLTVLRWQHDELVARPWIVELLVKGDLMAPSIRWLLEEIYATWLVCGLTHEGAVTANRIVWGFTTGALVRQAANPPDRPPYQVSVPLDAGDHPTLANLADYWSAPDRFEAFGRDLETLVNALLDSLRIRTQTHAVDETERLYRRWLFEVWGGDFAVAEEIFTPDVTGHWPGHDVRGPAEVVAQVKQSFDFFTEITTTLDVGPIVGHGMVAAQWTFSGAYAGGIPGATVEPGTKVSFRGQDIFRVLDGRFTEYWVVSDGLTMMINLGAFPQ